MTNSIATALTWADVHPGDWIRAESIDRARQLQGVVDRIFTDRLEDPAVSINDTRRRCRNWTLLEVRPADE